jgi:hypothetical protein
MHDVKPAAAIVAEMAAQAEAILRRF